MARKKKTKYEKVAKYLADHPLSAPKNVAKACGCSVKYVYNIRSQSGTPREVFEQEAQSLNVQPVITETFKDNSGNTYNTYALENKPVEERVRTKVLREAEDLVTGDREKEHGEFWSNAYLTAKLWYGYTGYDIQPEQVPVMLALLKVARSHQNPSVENFRDASGYMALAAELVHGESDD